MKTVWRRELSWMERRSFLGRSAFAAAGLVAGGAGPLLAQDTRGLPMSPIAQTGAGKIRGLVRFGVHQFFGVPYGASTAGANRFMPPVKPMAWTGVRDTVQVSQRSPQDPDGPISEVWSLDRREDMGEDCLAVNVFSDDYELFGAGSRHLFKQGQNLLNAGYFLISN